MALELDQMEDVGQSFPCQMVLPVNVTQRVIGSVVASMAFVEELQISVIVLSVSTTNPKNDFFLVII